MRRVGKKKGKREEWKEGRKEGAGSTMTDSGCLIRR